MWKESSQGESREGRRPVTSQASSSSDSSASDILKSRRVKVKIIRPDGSSRDIVVAGHFREEHLSSLVDDELCQLESAETLILHLYEPDDELTRSMRDRWHEGLSDSRQVFVREVLGPNEDPRQLGAQLQKIRRRMAAGEKIDLAIRSPKVASVACEELRKLLLISQQFEDSLLKVWVHGNEAEQRAILGRLADAGVVLREEYERFVTKHRDHRWKGPWLDFQIKPTTRKTKKHAQKPVSSQEAVSRWIKKVEEDRDHPH